MDNTVLIDDGSGSLRVGLVIYGYRQHQTDDGRIRLTTLEREHDEEVVKTRILIDSEDYDGQSGVYSAIEVSDISPIHDHLDDESNSGWIEGGRVYTVGAQSVITLTANDVLGLGGSILTINTTETNPTW